MRRGRWLVASKGHRAESNRHVWRGRIAMNAWQTREKGREAGSNKQREREERDMDRSEKDAKRERGNEKERRRAERERERERETEPTLPER